MLYINFDEESFTNLSKVIYKNLKSLNRGDVTDVLVGLINYCRSKALAGEPKYNFKTLEIYKLMSREEIWNDENLLRPTVYRGAASVAGFCKDFRWGEAFLKKFKDLQPVEHRNSNYYLCLARLRFDECKYSDALHYLNNVEFLDSSYKYETDTLQMRIFYELNDLETLFMKIDAFKHWISNNDTVISDRYRLIFKKMVSSFEKLAKLKINPDDFKIEKLKKMVIDDKDLVNRGWILEKINEIKKVPQ